MFPIYLNVFIFSQLWMNYFSFAQIQLKLLNRTQMLLIYWNVSNFTQNLNEFLWLAKFDEGCWNYHMIPVHSSAVAILPSVTKWMAKLSEIISPFWTLFCRWFGYYFVLFGKIDATSFTCECSCILCPNVEKFSPK